MVFQAVPDTVEIDHIFTLNGITVQNVYYAKLPTGYAQADLQAMADKIDAIFLTTYVTEQPPEVAYVKTEVRGLAFINDLVAEQNAGAGVGTHTGAAFPNNVTFSIKKTSGLTGRSARGRTYWIGIPDNEVQVANENLLKVAYAAQIVADVDFVRTEISGVGLFEPVLVSRFLDKVLRSPAVTFAWTGSTNVDLRVDTQRGRLPN